jgi:hypothetical protein
MANGTGVQNCAQFWDGIINLHVALAGPSTTQSWSRPERGVCYVPNVLAGRSSTPSPGFLAGG